MTWTQIRAQYVRVFAEAKARGETQATVARRGGLPRQNAISRVLSQRGAGPRVETFARAVEGLGVSVSAFFVAVELDDAQRLVDQLATRPPDATDQWQKVSRLLRELRHTLRTIERHTRRPPSR